MNTTLARAIIAIGLAHATVAASQNSPAAGKLEPLPRDLEIQLAQSALPPHLRDSATIYVLNPAKGFEIAHRGSNGFHALVARTGDDTFRGSWPLREYRTDILYPIGFDAAGAQAQMRIFLDAAEMQAKGMPAQRLKEIMRERYRTKYYPMPKRAGVAYMLAPVVRTFSNPDHDDGALTLNIPHVMYFSPNVSNEDVGGSMPTAEEFGYLAEHRHWGGTRYPFVILTGPYGYTVQFLGTAEREALTRQYDEILVRLCRINDLWCLPNEKGR